MRLEIEVRALRSEESGTERVETLEHEVVKHRHITAALRDEWNTQKQLIASIRKLIEREDVLRHEEQHARRTGNLERAAEIAYRHLPEASRNIEAHEAELASIQSSGMVLKDSVSRQDIYDVAMAWTGLTRDELT